ncbi:MAG TPA: hypothetical protein VNI52_05300 [Sphingobacteriaceae bacterium]|nr:hypothetical protein [Sphingobacteriaceae bacterium]
MKFGKLIIASLLLTAFYSCKKNDSSDKADLNITGKWFYELKRDDKLIFQDIYDFKTDETVEITRGVIDSATMEIKGYVNRSTGSFDFKGDSLILQDLKVYSVNAYGYKKLEELKYTTTYKRNSYKVIYNTNKDTITLQFHCPVNADCVPYPILSRVNKFKESSL